MTHRLVEVTTKDLRLAELLAALSHALDMTEGQPDGHCIRCCYIGQRLGAMMGLNADQMWELYYVLLLKDLGCSSNAARICELYLTDDLSFKRDFKEIGTGLPSVLQFVMSHTGLKADLAGRFRAVFNILQNGHDYSKELMQTRCSRGADIARKLRFSEAVALGVHDLDEHYDGKGQPHGLKAEAISPYARIALMAQVIDVFFTSNGPEAAKAEVMGRTGTWFDPGISEIFAILSQDQDFWRTLGSSDLEAVIFAMPPAQRAVVIDDDYLDDIAIAFGQIVDSKSPYTSGHSARVALFTDMIAESMGISLEQRRWLKRGALLHDLGKLGVSNTILDKPGKLDDDEWVQMRNHALFTTQILSHMACFETLAQVAGAHHERLDGKGYPLGLDAEDICLETRIISVADFFDALTADRPYREAMTVAKALEIMEQAVGTAIDSDCFAALKVAIDRLGDDVASGTINPLGLDIIDLKVA